jgi:hypothetical protein
MRHVLLVPLCLTIAAAPSAMFAADPAAGSDSTGRDRYGAYVRIGFGPTAAWRLGERWHLHTMAGIARSNTADGLGLGAQLRGSLVWRNVVALDALYTSWSRSRAITPAIPGATPRRCTAG